MTTDALLPESDIDGVRAIDPEEVQEFRILNDVVHENPYLLGGCFVGRQTEITDFTEWLKDGSSGRCMLCVCDFGGAGKTALVWHWLRLPHTRQLRASLGYREYWATFYAHDYGWRSFVSGFAQAVASASPVDIPGADDLKGWDVLIDDVLARVKKERWLIVLDGLEREMESYTSEVTLYMDSEEQDVRRESGTLRPDERVLQSRQFARFLRGLLSTPTRVLVTTRLIPEDLRLRQSLRPGVEEYPLRPLTQDDAFRLWWSYTKKGGSPDLLRRFFSATAYHPQIIAVVAAAAESSSFLTFEEWLSNESGMGDALFDPSQLKTVLRFRWLSLATQDLVRARSRTWVIMCLISARSGVSSVSQLQHCLAADQQFAASSSMADLWQDLANLRGRALVGCEEKLGLVDMHPVVRSLAAKYIVSVWKNGEIGGGFAKKILDLIRHSAGSQDAFLRVLSSANLDEAARKLDDLSDSGSYHELFRWMLEFYVDDGKEKPWLRSLPRVSIRKLQASVLYRSAYAARAMGDYDESQVLCRRAKIAYRLCGELEKVVDCERGEQWEKLYGGSIYDSERHFLSVLSSGRGTREDQYWLGLLLSIRGHQLAGAVLEKLKPGESRWEKQTLAESFFYLGEFQRGVEILAAIEDDPEPVVPSQLFWEWLTHGMCLLRCGKVAESVQYLSAANRGSTGFFYRLVQIFSLAGYGEYLLRFGRQELDFGRVTSATGAFEEAKVVLMRAIKMDKRKRFQIPIAEAYCSLAEVNAMLYPAEMDDIVDAARVGLEIANGKVSGFGYLLGIQRAQALLGVYGMSGLVSDLNVGPVSHEGRSYEEGLLAYLSKSMGVGIDSVR